jgi:RNA polymerase sigma-70 factor (ECF subfamily)
MASSGTLTRERILEIARTLPAAPQVFASLDRLLSDTNSPLEQIAQLIKRDAALAAHLIRISNSAALGGQQRAGSVEEAVGRVGYDEIFRLVGYVASAQLAERALKHYGVEASQLHEHMVLSAFVCEQLAIECGLDARTAYTAGLMRPIGLFVCDQLAGLYNPVESYHPLHDRDYLAWEGRLFGVGSCDVAALVLGEWKFPDDIVEAVRNQYAPAIDDGGHRLSCLLNLAGGLVANEGHGLLGETRHWATTQRKLDLLGLSEKRLQTAGGRARDAFLGFQRRLQKANPTTPAKVNAAMPGGPGGAVSPESCDFSVQVRVVKKNNETPVPTTVAEVTPPPDFTTFMRNYQDMVYSTAVRLIGNETQAEDIAQEVFIKAHEHFGNLRTSPTAGGWLKTVATNLSINHIQRYKKRWSFFSDLVHRDDEGGEKEVEFAAPDTFFSAVDSSERREWVESALEKLPDHQRVPLVLFHFEDMPYEDIAKKTGVSLSKVKTDILRGREALAKILVRSGTTHEKFAT